MVGMVWGQRWRGHLYWGHGRCRLMAETGGGGGLGCGVVGGVLARSIDVTAFRTHPDTRLASCAILVV